MFFSLKRKGTHEYIHLWKLLIEHENRKNADNLTSKSAGVRTGYSEVPNKHAARFILFGDFFLPTSYMALLRTASLSIFNKTDTYTIC